jgi:hypothetical protein
MYFSPNLVSLMVRRRSAVSNHGDAIFHFSFSSFETRAKCALLRMRNHTGVKNGNGAPSVALNTTFTFCPIFNFSMSQSTKLVRSDGPSFSVT